MLSMNDRQADELLKKKPQRLAMLLLVILAAGALFTSFTVARADREMREDLLQQARQTARTLDMAHVRDLLSMGASHKYIYSPVYSRIKEQLANVRSVNPQFRSVYLMGRKTNGSVIFLVDSKSIETREGSSPGRSHEMIMEADRRVFATRTESVEGPVADHWGKWVSALVPILDPKTTMYGLSTPEDARAMVGKAVDFYRKNGRERFLKEVNNPQGEFHKGDLYVFVYDRNMTWLAHPVTPELVGKNWIDKKDWSEGKYFRREIQEVARSKGHGWVEYEYLNPITKQHDHKTTYLEGLDDLIICSGAYRGYGEILAVLGVDIDASAWTRTLALAALPPVLLTLSMVAILLAGTTLLARRSRIADSLPDWMRRLVTWLVVGVGLVLTLFATWTAHQHEVHNRNEAFQQLASIQTERIAETLRDIRDSQLKSIAQLYYSRRQVPLEEFQQFAAYLTNNLAVSAWEWIPAVPAADKSRFEAAAHAEGLTGFQIWQKDNQGKRVSAFGRAVYYPVFRVVPLVGNERAVGFDLGSEPLRRAALEEAIHSKLITGTDPIALVQATGTQKAILLYQPVIGGFGSDLLRGFALAVLRMEALLKSVGLDKSVFIEISLLHKDAGSERLAMSWDAYYSPTSELFAKRPVSAFGKTFVVTTYAGPGFLHTHQMFAGWLTFLVGLALTGAFSVVVSLTFHRREELLRLVAERTHELDEAREYAESIINTVREPLIALDHDLRVVTASCSFYEVFKVNFEETLGQLIYDLGNKQWDIPKLRELLETILPQKATFDDYEVEHEFSTIGRRVMLLNARQIQRVLGKERIILLAIEDITERREIETGLENARKELKAANNEFQNLNDELTIRRQEAEEARTRADEASRAKSGFLANMSHELRTPLTAVIGFSDILADGMAGPITDEQKDLVQDISTSGRHLLSVINDILDMSKVEAGKMELEAAEFDLEHLITSSIGMFMEKALKHNIRFETEIEKEIGRITADERKIKQVMFNLINNAMKFTLDGGSVSVQARLTLSPNTDIKKVEISVVDTGIGISAQDQEKLFQPFQQIDSALSRQYSGTGLGLMLCKSFVELHGGKIWVESETGKGSRFVFEIPAPKVGAEAKQVTNHTGS